MEILISLSKNENTSLFSKIGKNPDLVFKNSENLGNFEKSTIRDKNSKNLGISFTKPIFMLHKLCTILTRKSFVIDEMYPVCILRRLHTRWLVPGGAAPPGACTCFSPAVIAAAPAIISKWWCYRSRQEHQALNQDWHQFTCISCITCERNDNQLTTSLICRCPFFTYLIPTIFNVIYQNANQNSGQLWRKFRILVLSEI